MGDMSNIPNGFDPSQMFGSNGGMGLQLGSIGSVGLIILSIIVLGGGLIIVKKSKY